ncbi:hypothetical protein MJO28_006020 [Puccinia striiformis f. sp. tritici]|uniref:Uncharacterized protein n=1 Tax=Puccinia striiformis f. sp. tritici TaxID=168172 RepID=A0ACC0EI26_9BASI|nr:hypothetical protein MJO28_006020 [Puccinia striiformis f. sp. tritici]
MQFVNPTVLLAGALNHISVNGADRVFPCRSPRALCPLRRTHIRLLPAFNSSIHVVHTSSLVCPSGERRSHNTKEYHSSSRTSKTSCSPRGSPN